MSSASYFTRIDDDSFQPEQACSGAWSASELHVAPPNGLLVHVLERWLEQRAVNPEFVISRIAIEYLGVLDFDPVSVECDVVRPGRAVELVEAVLSQKGRPVLRLRAWRVATSDTTAVAGGLDEPMPDPSAGATIEMDDRWPGDYVRSIELRGAGALAPGRGRVWMRTTLPIVAGEPSSTLARYALVLDTANGAAVREDPAAWHFPNLDLTVHLLRQPVSEWAGLDITVAFGPTGQGLTSVSLHDERGQVGRAELGLIVRARS